MTGPLDVAELRRLADEGAVDTVIVCFPDMQGRPVGKRVTAPFFFADVLEHGIEACDYLLAVDVDVSPLPGYRFASWESGYGDMRARFPTSTRSASFRGSSTARTSSAT